jgi:hypothetical protein
MNLTHSTLTVVRRFQRSGNMNAKMTVLTLKCRINLLSESRLTNKKFWEELIAYFPLYDMERIENDVSNNCIVACVFVAAVPFYLAVA